MNDKPHKPVLAEETIDCLSPKKGDKYLDLTAGYGGHASIVAELVGEQGELTLIDRDAEAVEYLRKHFGLDKRVNIIRGDFYSSAIDLLKSGEKFDCILADIGVSSLQLDSPKRGFSFDKEGPLDMRMDTSQEISALDVVNGYDKERLKKVLAGYGELTPKQASRLAGEITARRPLHSTAELVQAVDILPKRSGKKFRSQVFQAVRIEVNDELKLLRKSLPVWAELLAPKGRMTIISFHSLEDRIVKQFFTQRSRNRYEADLKLLNKGPITAGKNELAYNPRARSAKLRAAVKK